MEALLKALEKFLMRDIVFIVGGAAIILSFLFVYCRLPTKEWPVVFYIFYTGIAYGVGYAVQDLLILLRLNRSKAGDSPNWLGKSLFWLFDRKKAVYVEACKYEAAKRWLYDKGPQRFRDDHERTESLKQVGMTLGPCFVISGAIILGRPLLLKFEFERALAISAVALGVVLWLLGWLKATQQGQYMLRRAPLDSNDNSSKMERS